MENKTNISQLPSVQGVSKNDLLIVQNAFVTSSIKFENFILGPDNVSFYSEIKNLQSDVNGLKIASISATNTLQSLSSLNPGPSGDKSLIYVKETKANAGFDTGGMYVFDMGESTADNGATIIDPTSASVIGRWKRTDYDYIDPRWFGADVSSADNQSAFQAAIDYSTSAGIYKPVKIPNGTFTTSGISANGNGAHIIGSGNTILRQKTGPGSALLKITGDNCIIENIELIGVHNDGSTQNNIQIDTCDDVTVRNCRVQTASANNVVLIDTKRCKLTENLFYNAGANNIHILGTSPGTSERNVICNNIVYTAGGKDILEQSTLPANNPNYNVIASNTCDAVADLVFTGERTVRGLNAYDDGVSSSSPSESDDEEWTYLPSAVYLSFDPTESVVVSSGANAGKLQATASSVDDQNSSWRIIPIAGKHGVPTTARYVLCYAYTGQADLCTADPHTNFGQEVNATPAIIGGDNTNVKANIAIGIGSIPFPRSNPRAGDEPTLSLPTDTTLPVFGGATGGVSEVYWPVDNDSQGWTSADSICINVRNRSSSTGVLHSLAIIAYK